MSNPVDVIKEAIQQHIGGYQAQSGHDLHAFFESLPGMFDEMGSSFTSAAEGMTDEHIHPGVIDMLRQLAQVAAGVSQTAQQVYQTHTQEHKLWLQD
jgi:hypothetical protein